MLLVPAHRLNRRHIGATAMVPDPYGVPMRVTIQNVIHSVTGRVAIVYDNQAHWYNPTSKIHIISRSNQ